MTPGAMDIVKQANAIETWNVDRRPRPNAKLGSVSLYFLNQTMLAAAASAAKP